MRKLIISLAAATAALAVASPASAQYYGGQSYGYGQRSNDWGAVRTLQRRLNNVERSLGGVRPEQAYRIQAEANALERRLQIAARNGFNPYEAHDLDLRVNQLELRLQRAAGYGRYRGNDYNDYDRGHGRGHGGRDRDDD